MTLIPNWRQAWRFASVLGAVALATANLVIASSAAVQVLLPPHAAAIVNALAATAIAVARVIKQPSVGTTAAPAAPASKEISP